MIPPSSRPHVDGDLNLLKHVPFNGKARDTRLLGQDLPLHLLDNRLCGRLEGQCLIDVLVIDVVTDANKFTVLVTAAEEDDRDTDDLAVGDTR